MSDTPEKAKKPRRKVASQSVTGRGKNMRGKTYPQKNVKDLSQENKDTFYEREKALYEPLDTQSHPVLTPADLVALEAVVKCGHSVRQAVFRMNEIRVRKGHDEITSDTVYAYIKKFPERFGQLKLFAAEHLERIEASLGEIAEGAVVWEEKLVTVSDGADAGSHVEKHLVEKRLPPNFNSIQYILNNRMPHRWKNDQTLIIEGVQNMSDEELLAKAKEAFDNLKKKNKSKTE